MPVAAEVAAQLGFPPEVRFLGAIDVLVPDAAVDDLLAVVREALTNVGKHAHASSATVSLTTTPAGLDLQIVDDGVGAVGSMRRSGLDNLRRRAESYGGHLSITALVEDPALPGQSSGTTLRWSIPL